MLKFLLKLKELFFGPKAKSELEVAQEMRGQLEQAIQQYNSKDRDLSRAKDQAVKDGMAAEAALKNVRAKIDSFPEDDESLQKREAQSDEMKAKRKVDSAKGQLDSIDAAILQNQKLTEGAQQALIRLISAINNFASSPERLRDLVGKIATVGEHYDELVETFSKDTVPALTSIAGTEVSSMLKKNEEESAARKRAKGASAKAPAVMPQGPVHEEEGGHVAPDDLGL